MRASRRRIQAKEASHVLPRFLPGENTLLFTVRPHLWGARSHIETLSLDTGERKVLIEDGADARFVASGHLVYLTRAS